MLNGGNKFAAESLSTQVRCAGQEKVPLDLGLSPALHTTSSVT
jgi:hypothetical protein